MYAEDLPLRSNCSYVRPKAQLSEPRGSRLHLISILITFRKISRPIRAEIPYGTVMDNVFKASGLTGVMGV